MQTILFWYVAVSCILVIAVAVYLGLDDLYAIYIDRSRKDPKFGYHFGKTGMGWYFCAAFLPLLNLIIAVFVLFSWYGQLKDRMK